MPECETRGCGRDAEVHRIPKLGQVPSEKKLCQPCFRAWKSGAYTTGPGRYRTKPIGD